MKECSDIPLRRPMHHRQWACTTTGTSLFFVFLTVYTILCLTLLFVTCLGQQQHEEQAKKSNHHHNNNNNKMATEPVISKPDPNQVANHDLPIQVFIMTGQSNMLGFGTIPGKDQPGTLEYITMVEGKYPHLLVDDYTSSTNIGNINNRGVSSLWTKRRTVVYVYMDFNDETDDSGFLTVIPGDTYFGPELQVGHVLGHAFSSSKDNIDQPILLLKAGAGNRALGWDFLPPGSQQVAYHDGKTYAGHGQCPDSWSSQSAMEGDKTNNDECGCILGEECKNVWWSSKSACTEDMCWCDSKKCKQWYAGMQYDIDLNCIHEVLADIGSYFPGYKGQGFKIAGFFFWQGHRDMGVKSYADKYEDNLVQYIHMLRQDLEEYGSANAKFVVGTIGFDGCDLSKWSDDGMKIFDAQMAVSGEYGIYKKHFDTVKTVNARPFWRSQDESPGNEHHHYFHNANTYLEIGTAMGWAMADLIQNQTRLVDRDC